MKIPKVPTKLLAWQVLDELSPQKKRSCLVVDATQSLGVVPIAVKSAGIDWLAPWMPRRMTADLADL